MAIDQKPLTLFYFAKGRDAEVLRKCLDGYEGVVGSDGHRTYPAFARESGGKVKNAGCLDHFRKRLILALRAVPGLKEMAEEERLSTPAYVIWKKLNLVFLLDRETGKLGTREERNEYREKTVLPAFEEMAESVKTAASQKQITGSYTSGAIQYFQNQEEHLRVFLDDGEIASNNSKCERKFALFAVLRNQIKMFGSFRGAETAAALESIEQTAQEYISDTRLYYKFLIEEYCPFVRNHTEHTDISLSTELDTFLPWSDRWKTYEKEAREKETAVLETICEYF